MAVSPCGSQKIDGGSRDYTLPYSHSAEGKELLFPLYLELDFLLLAGSCWLRPACLDWAAVMPGLVRSGVGLAGCAVTVGATQLCSCSLRVAVDNRISR